MRLAEGTLQLTARDVDGGPLSSEDLPDFEVQASTNLVDWRALTNQLRLFNGSLQLQDTDSTNHRARFYRVLER